MPKGRIEAFSDGVMAVIITITVLDIKVPHGAGFADLLPMTPLIVAYVLSFTYVGIYWNNHHHLMHAAKQVTGRIMWANLHLLFWLSLFPVATAWAGEYPDAAAPAADYGVVLLAAALAWLILQRQIVRAGGSLGEVIGSDLKGKLSVILYVLGIALAFVHGWAAEAVYGLVAVMWIVPDRRIERQLREGG